MNFKGRVESAIGAIAGFPPLRTLLRAAGHAGWLPESISSRLPVNALFESRLPNGNSFWYRSFSADGIGRRLYWLGPSGFEPDTVEVLMALARKATRFVDIGANTGVLSMLAAASNPELRVVAFEPVPAVLDRMREHVRMSRMEDRIEMRHEALSNTYGTAKIYVPNHAAPVGASLRTGGLRGTGTIVIDVPVTTLDAVCADGPRLDLVKIDVEGFEDKVLEGMPRILREHKPVLLVEALPDGPYQRVEELLTPHGYRFHHLVPGGPRRMPHITPDPRQICQNYLCTLTDDWRAAGPEA